MARLSSRERGAWSVERGNEGRVTLTEARRARGEDGEGGTEGAFGLRWPFGKLEGGAGVLRQQDGDRR